MVFSELYGTYFNTVAAVLSAAVAHELTGRSLTEIVQRTAFGESLLTIPAALKEEAWPFLDRGLGTTLKNRPTMPLSTLQKRWLKALLQDPRIALFEPSAEGLEDVEPLYSPDAFVFFDRYSDGDPYEDETYREHFRILLRAMREKRKVRIGFQGRKETQHSYICVPYKLEYSAKDDKFRLLTARKGKLLTVNVARIRELRLLATYSREEYTPVDYCENHLVMELRDERNALERVLLHFSDLQKETEKLDEKRYRIKLWYKQGDETEILIRILSFGPVLRVLEPDPVADRIRERLERQFCLQDPI